MLDTGAAWSPSERDSGACPTASIVGALPRSDSPAGRRAVARGGKSAARTVRSGAAPDSWANALSSASAIARALGHRAAESKASARLTTATIGGGCARGDLRERSGRARRRVRQSLGGGRVLVHVHAGEQREERGARGPDVRSRPDRVGVRERLLRRHERRRPDGEARARHPRTRAAGLEHARDPEVEDLERALARDEAGSRA